MLALYSKSNNGVLNRRVENWSDCSKGTQSKLKQKDNYLNYLKDTFQFSENPEIEILSGWPESKIEWHGNYGIGIEY